MSNDLLEQQLRAMFRERADDIQTYPRQVTEAAREGAVVEVLLPPPAAEPESRRLGGPAILAAAAVILLIVAAGVLVSRRLHNDQSEPAKPNHVIPTCLASLPAAWTAARDQTLGSPNDDPRLLVPAGGVILVHSEGTRETIELLRGQTSRVLYEVPQPSDHPLGQLTTDGRWLVIPVLYLPLTVGVESTVTLVVLVDLNTGAKKVLAQASGTGPTIDGAALVDGAVYWDQRPSKNSHAGTVIRYDLANDTQHTVFSGSVDFFTASAAGLSWHGFVVNGVDIAAKLPSAVTAGVGGEAVQRHLASDGTSWVWLADRDVIGWWQPGMSTPHYTAIPQGAVATTNDLPVTLGIAGTVVVAGGYFVDARTGATAAYSATHDGMVSAFAGRLLMYHEQGSVSHDYLLDTAALPELTC